MKLASGPNKGFYSLPNTFINDNSVVEQNTVYSKLLLHPGIRLYGINKDYLTYSDGYYYLPRIEGLDARKVIYALEQHEIPSSGNTETFLRDFQSTVNTPIDYRPYFLDPCEYDWCNDKQQPHIKITENPKRRNIYMFLSMLFIAFIFTISIMS